MIDCKVIYFLTFQIKTQQTKLKKRQWLHGLVHEFEPAMHGVPLRRINEVIGGGKIQLLEQDGFLAVIYTLKIPNTIGFMLVNDIVEAAVESEFMRLYPIEFVTFFGCKMKLNELIFRNG